MRLRALLTLVFLLLAVAVVAGCGGGDDDGNGSSDEPSAAADGSGSGGDDSGSDGDGSSGDSSDGEGSSVQEIKLPNELNKRFKQLGKDVSAEDREQILAALVPFREAMAAEDWGAACPYLQAALREDTKPPEIPENLPDEVADQIEIPEDFPKTCTERLEQAAETPGPENLDSTMRVAAVRGPDDDRAFVIYRAGGEAKWYMMSMVREDGEWKVGAGRPLPVG